METLHVELTSTTLRQLKARASIRGDPLGVYADMLFHYFIREKSPWSCVDLAAPTGESLYLTLEIPLATKQRLSLWSQKYQITFAAFAGLLLNAFLGHFEKDPRDLAMIHYVSSLLDQKGVLSDAELRIALSRCEQPVGLRLPDGHMTKWLYARLKPFIREIERNGKLSELTQDLIALATCSGVRHDGPV